MCNFQWSHLKVRGRKDIMTNIEYWSAIYYHIITAYSFKY